MPKLQKLYCYVDETGQDPAGDYFIVVTITSKSDQELLRKQLLEIEKESMIGLRKWHKAGRKEKVEYLRLAIKSDLKETSTFFGKFKKPLPFFLPILETLAAAIKQVAEEPYTAIVYIDGIDKKKSRELTNALRLKGINLSLIRSVRDESEPVIRLADRWAGCIRDSEETKEASAIVNKAKREKSLIQI